MLEETPDNGAPKGYQLAPVAGFPGYIVSTYGEVMTQRFRWPSMKRGVDCPRELKQSYAGRKYRKVSLIAPDGKQVTRYVHQLVAEAFVPGKSVGLEVRHWDGDKEHNHASNLFWGTRKENGQDSIRQGKTRQGEKSLMSKLTAEQVREIKRAASVRTQTQRAIADRFGISQSLVSMISTGVVWGHLSEDSQ